jgi:hypothetical protein
MGLLAVVCGLVLAALLSAAFGAHSAGPPATLKTVAAPAPDLGKLRHTAAHTGRVQRSARHHKRVHRARRHHRKHAPSTSPTVVALGSPTNPNQGYGPSYQTGYASPQQVQQISTPTYTAPVKKPVTRRKQTSPNGGTGGNFDDSG